MAFFQMGHGGQDTALSGAVTLATSGTNDFFVFNGTQSSVDVVLNISGTATFRSPDVYDNNRRVDHDVAGSAEVTDSDRVLTIKGLQPNDTFWSTYTGAASSSFATSSNASTTHQTGTVLNQRVYVVIN